MRGPWKDFDQWNATYERLTDRARLTLSLAEQFAIKQHAPQIEPEHILRGIASFAPGVGGTVLKEMGIDLFSLLPEIDKLLPTFPKQPVPADAHVILARIEQILSRPIETWRAVPTEQLRILTKDLSRYFPEKTLGAGVIACLEAARTRATELNHRYLGTEHLVMGLIDGQSSASAFLQIRGATPERFREGVIRLLYGETEPDCKRRNQTSVISIPPELAARLHASGGSSPKKQPGPTNATRRLMRDAEQIARGMNHEYIGSEHIALAICNSPDTSAARLFDACGGDRARLADWLHELVKCAPGPIGVEELPLTPPTRRAMKHATLFAGDAPVQTAHVLLGLLTEWACIAANAIACQSSVDLDSASKRLAEIGAEISER